MGMDWRHHPRHRTRCNVRLGVLMRNKYLDIPSKWQVIGAVCIGIVGLSFIYVVFKITIGIILCLISLL